MKLFPNQDYEDALAYALKHAKKWGLEYEVQMSFEGFVRGRKLTRDEYFNEAEGALYEWDI